MKVIDLLNKIANGEEVPRENIYNEDFLRHIIYEYFDEREQHRVADQIKYKLISRE